MAEACWASPRSSREGHRASCSSHPRRRPVDSMTPREALNEICPIQEGNPHLNTLYQVSRARRYNLPIPALLHTCLFLYLFYLSLSLSCALFGRQYSIPERCRYDAGISQKRHFTLRPVVSLPTQLIKRQPTLDMDPWTIKEYVRHGMSFGGNHISALNIT